MKKLFYLSFCAALALGVGCAVTDYGVITDNDQVANGQGNGIVNTNGKALIRLKAQVATIWPDGTDELLWFVDQKANGDQTLTTYNNFSSGSDPIFHDDLYCTPDRQGCWITSAPNPIEGDTDPFDYSANPNCRGYRSLSFLIATGRYYSECGRARIGLEDRIRLMNMGRIGTSLGMNGLFYDVNNLNTTIRLSNMAGFETTLPVTASTSLFLSYERGRLGTLDLTHPGFRAMGNYYADFLQNHASNTTEVTVVFNGISFSKTIAGKIAGREVTQPSRVREIMNTRY